MGLHPFGSPFPLETYISQGESALEDDQWLCGASKDKGNKGKWKSSYHLLPGDTLIRRGSSARFGST